MTFHCSCGVELDVHRPSGRPDPLFSCLHTEDQAQYGDEITNSSSLAACPACGAPLSPNGGRSRRPHTLAAVLP